MVRDSSEERRRKNREKQKKYRQNLKEEDLQKIREKDKERHKKNREKNPFSSLPEKEKQIIRKNWMKRARRYRQSKHNLSVNKNDSLINLDNAQKRKIAGRKKVKRDRSSVHRSLNKMTQELAKERNKSEAQRKKISRLESKIQDPLTNSPRSKVKTMILKANGKISDEIKKKLIVGEVISDQLKKNNEKKSIRDKIYTARLLLNSYVKKYKLAGKFKEFVSKRRIKSGVDTESMKKKICLSLREGQRVREFLEEDINSRMCPGKRDHSKNVQKRFLLAPLCDLHKKYCEKFTSKMSLKTFQRLKPSWIVRPKMTDRNTCACVKHENFQFLINALHQNSLIRSNKLSDVCEDLCCSVENKSCMFRSCLKCNSKKLFTVDDSVLNNTVAFYQWTRITEKRIIKDEEKDVKLVVKEKRTCAIKDLIDEYNSQEDSFLQHEYNRIHQYKAIKSATDNLKKNEILMRIDFSENPVLKYHKEIHSMHFGASKANLSLHTGVQYSKKEELTPKCFATVSKDLDHSAPGIWAHLRPVLSEINNDSKIDTLHFASDGPTTQYKNRYNLFLVTKQLPKLCPSVKFCTWNYTASGHGKGPMDGVGGSLKRNADSQVAHGNDITTVEEFVSVLQTVCPKISLTEIPSQNIDSMKSICKQEISPIPNVMKMHQAVWDKSTPSSIYTRSLSCFECKKICCHHKMGNGFIKFEKKKTKTSKNSTKTLSNPTTKSQVQKTKKTKELGKKQTKTTQKKTKQTKPKKNSDGELII